jgi:hypothetical protein
MNVDRRQRAEYATLNRSHVNAEGRVEQQEDHMLSLDLSLDCSASLSSAQSLGTTLAVSTSKTLAPRFTCCSWHACDFKILFFTCGGGNSIKEEKKVPIFPSKSFFVSERTNKRHQHHYIT